MGMHVFWDITCTSIEANVLKASHTMQKKSEPLYCYIDNKYLNAYDDD